MLNSAENEIFPAHNVTFKSRKNSILGLSESKKAELPDIYTHEHLKFLAQQAELSMKFLLLINVKMPTIVGSTSSSSEANKK